MSVGGGTNKSLRKALGAIKDKTTVSLAMINSHYKELDFVIVKATNHVKRQAKERHIRAIFAFISASRPRADVVYCINALARRLTKTHNWAVALKTLIVIHRALRQMDPSFQEKLVNYGASRGHMLNMAHFKDDSSPNCFRPSSNPYPISDGTNGWELVLVTAPSSNESATAASQLAGGLDLLTPDGQYDEGNRRNNQNVSYNPWEQQGPTMMQQPAHDPFFASSAVAAPHSVQMAVMTNPQQAFMYQQIQQMPMMPQPYQQQAANPFSNLGHPQAYSPYACLI